MAFRSHIHTSQTICLDSTSPKYFMRILIGSFSHFPVILQISSNCLDPSFITKECCKTLFVKTILSNSLPSCQIFLCWKWKSHGKLGTGLQKEALGVGISFLPFPGNERLRLLYPSPNTLLIFWWEVWQSLNKTP